MGELKLDEKYTYDDYALWGDDARYELVDGVPYLMAAPSGGHQEVLINLAVEIGMFLKGKKCKVRVAPFDVRLNYDKGNDTVLQPDLIVVCDPDKFDDKGLKGTPDLALEVLSPSSIKMDRFIKFNKYMHAGVKEYWIVDPFYKTITVYLLKEEGVYQLEGVYSQLEDDEEVKVNVVDGLVIKLADIFGEAHPKPNPAP